jgi:uncharacterized protein (DUF362 family)
MNEPTGVKRRLFTRRRFLVAGGSIVALGSLGFGGYVSYGYRQRFGRSALDVIPDHRVDLPTVIPQMVVARGGDPAVNVRAAIERLGGMRNLLTPDDTVLIKPNIGWQRPPEHAANTHPDVVAEIVRLCREAGPKRVIVTDCPIRKSRAAFEWSGILEASAAAGAEVIIPEDSSYRTVLISERLGAWDILEPFVTATKIINVPVAKNHNLMGSAAGMKNWIGVTTKLRYLFHNDIDASIAELALLMKPTLTVVDATRVLMHGGPAGGSLAAVNPYGAVAAGFDPVALDAWATSIFPSSADSIPEYLRIAERMGLGSADFRSLQAHEIITGNG